MERLTGHPKKQSSLFGEDIKLLLTDIGKDKLLGDDVLEISGKFDENLISIIQTLNFEQTYEITVERKIQKGLTKTHKPTDTIIDIKGF